MSYKIAVVGATGNVGREILNILAERKFPASEVVPLASRRSLGVEVSYGDRTLVCKCLDEFDFTGTDIVLSSAGGSVSKDFAPRATAKGAIIIDNTSAFRMDPNIPLIVPEVNPEALADYKKKNIIANPNCSTIQLMVALKPLHDHAKIKRVVVSTYQSVSGTGKEAIDELYHQTRAFLVGDPMEANVYPKQIAFNVLPHGGDFMDSGDTTEEWKMVAETKKILDPKIKLTCTVVRVPVFVSHSEAVNIEFEKPIDDDEVRGVLRQAPGVLVIDKREPGGYITPIDAVGDFATFVSRIRTDPTIDNGINMWVVSDNLRKGAALNAIQIAELLVENHLKK